MSNNASNFTDLIQRVTASCLLHPLGSRRHEEFGSSSDEQEEMAEEGDCGSYGDAVSPLRSATIRGESSIRMEVVCQMEALMEGLFEAAAGLKRAYVAVQEAHSPWDPQKMREADVAVVAELRKMGVFKDRFRRIVVRGGKLGVCGIGGTLREVVAPYEAAIEEMKTKVKTRDAEIESLKEKLKTVANLNQNCGGGSKRWRSSRRVSCFTQAVPLAPAPDVFEATRALVVDATKSLTSLLLSLMRTARWDIAAAVRSIEVASSAAATMAFPAHSSIPTQHAKYALESYISRKFFQGFDHETFYMDGSLSSLLNPEQYRRDCFTQYRDMKSLDPVELLGILPTCQFGNFCFKKYLAIVHPKMEESLFGDTEQRCMVLAGTHPRTQFYIVFLELAKAVWLLHLLAFSLDPPPSHFEASRGAEYHPRYMESVVKFSEGRVPAGQIVGFPVSPGFKLRTGSVIKARVYLVNKA